jgi:hypothetical protein
MQINADLKVAGFERNERKNEDRTVPQCPLVKYSAGKTDIMTSREEDEKIGARDVVSSVRRQRCLYRHNHCKRLCGQHVGTFTATRSLASAEYIENKRKAKNVILGNFGAKMIAFSSLSLSALFFLSPLSLSLSFV